jgi:hypothetical protein
LLQKFQLNVNLDDYNIFVVVVGILVVVQLKSAAVVVVVLDSKIYDYMPEIQN